MEGGKKGGRQGKSWIGIERLRKRERERESEREVEIDRDRVRQRERKTSTRDVKYCLHIL